MLTRHYIRCSWILMRVAVGLMEWPQPWWWLVYPRDTPTENWIDGKFVSLDFWVQKGHHAKMCRRKQNITIGHYEKLKNGCHFVNIDRTEKFQITDPPKFGSLVFRVSTETEYHCQPLWKNWKMAAILLILIVQKNFISFFNFFIMADGDIPSTLGKLETQIFRRFSFPNFSISSVFPVTLLKFHFNIYAWVCLKHFCMVTFLHLEI